MSQQPPKKILFVDDDIPFLDMLQQMMKRFAGDRWQILTAPNASKGLGVLQQERVDLLVIDLHMPIIDGQQFLSLLQRKFPNLTKVILTGDPSPEQRAAALSNGADLYFEKPGSSEEWKGVFEALNELSSLKQEDGFRGVLRQVGLPDVLQLSCLARQSIVLRVRTSGLEGSIFIKEGEIIHAQSGDKAGEEAFNFLMSLSGGEFDLQPFKDPGLQSINQQWEFLLMEAARKRDEVADAPPISTNTEMLFKQLAGVELKDDSQLTQPGRDVAAKKIEELQARVDEILVCTVDGEVLHEWQCPSTAGRLGFLEFLVQKARSIGDSLSLGELDRLEVNGPNARMITQFQPEHVLFVRTSRVPVETPAA